MPDANPMPDAVGRLVQAAEAFTRTVYASQPAGPDPRVTDRGTELADAIAAVRAAYDPPPYTPEHFYDGGDGRWYWNGIDVTDTPMWWQCSNGHSYQQALGAQVAGATCPECSRGTPGFSSLPA